MTASMKDFERWRSANAGQEFSLFDYAYAALCDTRAGADLALAMTKLVWPRFVEVEGCVFLGEQYSLAKESELRSRGFTGPDLEFWINLFSVDGLVRGLPSTSADHEEELALLLRDSWDAKLKKDFPDRFFLVRIVRDEDVGDVCLVFTQA